MENKKLILNDDKLRKLSLVFLVMYNRYKDLNHWFDFEDYIDYVLENIMSEKNISELGVYINDQYYKIQNSQDFLNAVKELDVSDIESELFDILYV